MQSVVLTCHTCEAPGTSTGEESSPGLDHNLEPLDDLGTLLQAATFGSFGETHPLRRC